jgi:ubiquinone/menaquinone biosynthesis C-methylase UbiE
MRELVEEGYEKSNISRSYRQLMNLEESASMGDYYDDVSMSYDFSRRAGEKTVKLLKRLLGPLSSANVLDIGCGTGNFLVELESCAGELFGLDISAGMLAQASGKGLKSSLILGDAINMPFSDESFNAAIGIQILHHIEDKRMLLSEVSRILEREGRFIIQSCSHEQLSTFWFYHYFPSGLDIDKKRVPDFSEIKDLLNETGFEKVEVHQCPFEIVFRETPELYLDEKYRAGASTFSLLSKDEIGEGCEEIRKDLRSGRAAGVVAEYDRKAEELGGRVSFIKCIKP